MTTKFVWIRGELRFVELFKDRGGSLLFIQHTHRVHRRVSEGRKPFLKHLEKNKFNKCFPYFKISKCSFNFPGLNKGKIKETLIKSKRKFENIYHFPRAERLIKFVLS